MCRSVLLNQRRFEYEAQRTRPYQKRQKRRSSDFGDACGLARSGGADLPRRKASLHSHFATKFIIILLQEKDVYESTVGLPILVLVVRFSII